MKPQVIVIVGPTASGKTSTSIELAKKLNGEIISADSMQIYKYMDIGTAKPTMEEKEGIKHYLLDIVNPDEEFNLAKYKLLAEEAIEEILAKGKTPIIVGGTGLYVSTLTDGIELLNVEGDIEYREEMVKLAEENGAEYLHQKLREIDSASADKIDMNNIRRVARALEMYHVTGKTKSQLDQESRKEVKYDYKIFAMDWPREELYERIDKRVDIMMDMGLIEEVKNLREKFTISNTAIQGLGYKEVIDYLDGIFTKDEMIEKLKLETRHYAKRQLTWFRKDKKIKWVNAKDSVSEIMKTLNN